MTDSKRVEMDEKLRGDSTILKRGVDTDFWRLVKEMISKIKDHAKDTLVTVDPTDIGTIAQLQKTAQVVDMLINIVEETATLT